MSTIASPRPSFTLSSRRGSATSLSTTTTSRSPSRAPAPASTRRNRDRAALRDYYNLKSPAPSAGDSNISSTASLPSPPLPTNSTTSALDDPGFDASTYLTDLLSHSSLEEVMRAEAALIQEIRGLDGERKALVYDNYSKLIAATETIGRMRGSMEPLSPATSTLSPAVSHIAETAGLLAGRGKSKQGVTTEVKEREEKEKQRETVKWVLDAPRRLKGLRDGGKEEDARSDWEEVARLLEKWKDVQGVEDVRRQCEVVMSTEG